MLLEYRNIIVFLLIFALFLGATIEISEGSVLVGIILFAIAVLLISRVKIGESYAIKHSKFRIFIGAVIIACDILYNITVSWELGTLDIMTFLLGASLIASAVDKNEISRIGKFGTYMSATFIVLFLIFFSLFNYLEIDFTHKFDHYFVMMPSIIIINALGLPIEVIGIETVRIKGVVEDMNVIIGGPCSGLYSMFLLIGIIVAYKHIENIEKKRFFTLLPASIAIAYTANLTRVTTLYVVGYYFGKDLMYMVHVHLGWIIFVVVVAALLHVLEKMSASAVRHD
ncbi:MAG: archaeosortase C [Canidatus Methanoxibalbensis ujae]|nr:archaeosortase C [Candidatus Methanoxibalbensis ujae]